MAREKSDGKMVDDSDMESAWAGRCGSGSVGLLPCVETGVPKTLAPWKALSLLQLALSLAVTHQGWSQRWSRRPRW